VEGAARLRHIVALVSPPAGLLAAFMHRQLLADLGGD
jgi:hypothetical protein